MTCNTEERYLSATNSSNLRVEAERTGPADILICAGWSASIIGGDLMRLQTKPSTAMLARVLEHVTAQAVVFKIEHPQEVSSAVVAWWINGGCKTCHGSGLEGTCPACKGTGKARLPHGEAGRKMASYLDQCKASGVESIKRRLKARRA